MPLAPDTNPAITFTTASLPVNPNELLLYIVDTSWTTCWLLAYYWNLAKSQIRIDQEPDHCTLHDLWVLYVLGSQALFLYCARWHVLELEQEWPQHSLHCSHTHTRIPKHYLSVVVVAWAQDKGTQAHDAEVRPCRAQPLICVHFKMYYCTPHVCIPDLLGALAVWCQNINIYIYMYTCVHISIYKNI